MGGSARWRGRSLSRWGGSSNLDQKGMKEMGQGGVP